MNSRITPKERNLIKGSIRRVFARSELRRQVIDACMIKGHSDSKRQRVKSWGKCNGCGQPTPKSYLIVDHIVPVISTYSSLEEMTWDEVINNMWCNIGNLQALCEECHKVKTKLENKLRREYKKVSKK